MKQIRQYILEALGTEVRIEPTARQKLVRLPMYIGEIYRLFDLVIFDQLLILAEPKQIDEFSILQTEKHFELLKRVLNKKVILGLPEITAINRKRLIERRINFIVPGKQLYLPDLLIDLNENFTNPGARGKKETLLPSAQFLMIYHLMHSHGWWKLEEFSFKEIAAKTGYTPMAITKAVDNLKHLGLIDVRGEKEKFIHFRKKGHELWQEVMQRNLLVKPVIKRLYVDKIPEFVYVLKCNESALTEYSDLNPGKQECYAIEKNDFYSLQKRNVLVNANEHEGNYCLEIWKYDPEKLVGKMQKDAEVVDPLSLYLSLRENPDERIQMALEQIIDQFPW